MASTSFGMGLAVGLELPLVASVLGPRGGLDRGARLAVWATPLAVIVLYSAVRGFDAQGSPGQVAELVSVRAALGAWRYALSMLVQMVPYALSVLCFGFLGAPTGDPPTWRLVIGAGCMVAVVAASKQMTPLARRRLLAAAAIAMLAYGIVVAGRAPVFQLMDWSAGQAATINLHYHAFPSIGLVLCLCLAWNALTATRNVWGQWANVGGCLWLIAWAVGLFANRPAIVANEKVRADVAAALEDVRSQVPVAPASTVVIPNRPVRLGGGVPCNISGLAGVFLMAFGGRDELDGRAVRFAVPMSEWQSARAQGRRIATLLVPEGY